VSSYWNARECLGHETVAGGTPDDAACPQCDRLRSINAGLLTACKAALAELEAYLCDAENREGPEDVDALEQTIDQARQAIARAEGGAP
jgi:hypothetical protein